MASILKPGLYRGVVKDFNPQNNTLKVQVRDQNITVPCLWAAGLISGMLGFKTTYYPNLKTEVVLWWPENDSVGYVVGTVPATMIDPGMQRRTATGGAPADDYSSLQSFHKRNAQNNRIYNGHKPVVDLTAGEFDMSNWLGVGITMLRNMASIQAGDLARVECHILDDMVRIISDTFRQYTAFGDFEIYNDGGKLNVVWNGTSQDFEAWGNRTSTDPKAPIPSRADVGDNLLTPDGTDAGRWRFTQYIGWLGNFIHLYVTDPVNQLGKIAADQVRAGKFHAHVNNDGSFILQSVADIVLEKVVAIPVPIPIRTPDDTQGNLSDNTSTVEPKIWQPSNAGNMFEMVFQLREYARWLNNSYSLSRFGQQTRDYRIPSEAESVTGQAGIALRYATIRIYRDGSIQTVDAYGNVITTTQTGIQVSTPKDFLIQAGGSVNVIAGRDINMVARQNVNIDAVTAAVRIKAQTAMMFFCAAGNIIYEAAAAFLHKFIGTITANNTVTIFPTGNIESLGSMISELVITGDLIAGATGSGSGTVTSLNMQCAKVTANEVHGLKVFQTNPPIDSNGTWPDAETAVPAINPVSIQVMSIGDTYQRQTNYGVGQLYKTLTQQMLDKGDIATTGTVWNFSDNAADGRGPTWPGNVQELTTSSGDKLNSPTSSTTFSEQPAALSAQAVSIKTA